MKMNVQMTKNTRTRIDILGDKRFCHGFSLCIQIGSIILKLKKVAKTDKTA